MSLKLSHKIVLISVLLAGCASPTARITPVDSPTSSAITSPQSEVGLSPTDPQFAKNLDNMKISGDTATLPNSTNLNNTATTTDVPNSGVNVIINMPNNMGQGNASNDPNASPSPFASASPSACPTGCPTASPSPTPCPSMTPSACPTGCPTASPSPGCESHVNGGGSFKIYDDGTVSFALNADSTGPNDTDGDMSILVKDKYRNATPFVSASITGIDASQFGVVTITGRLQGGSAFSFTVVFTPGIGVIKEIRLTINGKVEFDHKADAYAQDGASGVIQVDRENCDPK